MIGNELTLKILVIHSTNTALLHVPGTVLGSADQQFDWGLLIFLIMIPFCRDTAVRHV